MSRWTLAPVTGDTVAELRASMNARTADLDLILAEIEQVELQVKGQGGYTAKISNMLDMQGNPVTGLPMMPRHDSEACSLGFHKMGGVLYSETGNFNTDKTIEHADAVTGRGSVTLDQLRAILADALMQAVPPGIIVLWSGTLATIPRGWALCDGTNGTVDLRDVFVPGAGNGYAQQQMGGADSVNLAHIHNADGTLAAASAGAHAHTFAVTSSGGIGVQNASNSPANISVNTDTHTHSVSGSTSTDGAHTHDVTGDTSSSLSATTENRPAFKAMYYIQKL